MSSKSTCQRSLENAWVVTKALNAVSTHCQTFRWCAKIRIVLRRRGNGIALAHKQLHHAG